MNTWYDLQDDFHREHDNWWRKLIKGLNNALNDNHAWFDYDAWEEKATNKGYFVDNLTDGLGSAFSQLPELLNSLIAYYGRTDLTGAEKAQNEWNAAEAEKSRQFTEYMQRNKYSMETGSMQDAGVNPAMVYGGGNLVSTASNGATGSGSLAAGGNMFDMLTAMMRLPLEMKQIKAETAKIEADEELTRQKKLTEEAESRIRAINADYQEQLNGQTLDNLKADYNNTLADTDYKTAQKDYVVTQKDAQSTLNKYLDEKEQAEIKQMKANADKISQDEKKAKAETTYQTWYNNFVQKNNFLPSSNDALMLATYVASLFGIGKDNVVGWITDLFTEGNLPNPNKGKNKPLNKAWQREFDNNGIPYDNGVAGAGVGGGSR